MTLKIESVEIARLKPAPYNARRPLTDAERRQLGKSLDLFGPVDPAVINADDTIIGGHQRIEVAAELGWHSFPCVRVRLGKIEEKQLNLALNKIGGGFDEEKLAAIIAELIDQATGDLDASGFDTQELDHIVSRTLSRAGLVAPDDLPDVPDDPLIRPGEVWLLGRHRLLCGDATDGADVGRLLDGESPELMVTDPPYGDSYDPSWRVREAEKGNLVYAARRTGKVLNDDRCDWRAAWALSPSSVVYVWHGGLHSASAAEALQASGFKIRAQIIWAKRHLPISRGNYHWRHEPCYYAVRNGASALWVGDRRQSTLWDDISLDPNVEGGHSTQKPTELMARAIRNHRGDVFDPFVGSGTTIIASEMEGRRCFAMDVSPTYCDVTRIRWESYTGEKAKREERGSRTPGT
ncbi:MAG: site-specific DNA-methyltransferase [Actinomycetota bacterium]